jgi:hypothetical protein
MSMSAPIEPGRGTPDEEIPAADPGPGAPPPADGFGTAGEEPDRHAGQHADPPDDPPDRPRDDTPFRTPDPGDVGRP